jgi:hypothetical protein
MIAKIPVSIGELLDKITILQIKEKYTNNDYITKELNELTKIARELKVYNSSYLVQLYSINKILWDIEDEIRQFEKKTEFNERFIELSRSVYINNDKRAEIKRKINEETNSNFKEIKLY